MTKHQIKAFSDLGDQGTLRSDQLKELTGEPKQYPSRESIQDMIKTLEGNLDSANKTLAQYESTADVQLKGLLHKELADITDTIYTAAFSHAHAALAKHATAEVRSLMNIMDAVSRIELEIAEEE